MEEDANKDAIAAAAVAAAYIAAGSYVAHAYDGKYNEDPGMASITDEVVERVRRGEEVEVRCDSEGDCEITD